MCHQGNKTMKLPIELQMEIVDNLTAATKMATSVGVMVP
jgi:hypothetical protein